MPQKMMDKSGKPRFVIRQLAGPLAVVRLDPAAQIPPWAWSGSLCAVVRTREELSIVCDESVVPAGVVSERGWVAFMLEGPLPFSMTGVLSSLLQPLAAAGVSVFALSTFDTDYILVKAELAERTRAILHGLGHDVHPPAS